MFSGGIPIGRFFGITVKLHWSWFIVFFIVTWILATQYFPSIKEYESWNTATRWILGMVTSILFFASVLAHELAHSVVAKAGGVKVSAITLFIFGGVSQLTEEPKSPGQEFRMAAAGPGTSLVIAGACWGVFLATEHPVSMATGIALWLGYMNTVLAGFNLIPGFPLDGGRVLRSVMWWRTRNLRRSTRIASIVGRVFAFLFIISGVALIFTPYWSNGLWLFFVGFLLESAAAGSYRQVELQGLLQGHKVSEVMTRDCQSISPSLTLEQLVSDYILVSGRRCYSVVDYGRTLGVVTAQDVRAIDRKLWHARTVGDIMTPLGKLRQARPDDDLSSLMYLLTDRDASQTPVLQDDNVVGTVWRDNLINFIHLRSELGA